MIRHLTYLLILLATIGCKRYTTPEVPEGGDPIFKVEGSLDGTSISWIAGVDHVAENFEKTDSLDVTYYEGSISPCIGCPSDFSLRWRANSLDNPDLIQTTSERNPIIRYSPGERPLTIYDVDLKAETYFNVQSFEWTILGNKYTTPNVSLSVEESELTFLPIRLDVVYGNGCSASTIDTVFLPNHGCDCQIQGRQLDSLLFEYKTVRSNANAFSWLINQEAVSSSREITYQYPAVPSGGVREIRMVATRGNCRSSARYNQLFTQVPSACAVNFNYQVETRIVSQPGEVDVDLGEVEITIVDENGIEFRSDLVQQDSATFFRVISAEEFQDAFASDNAASMKIEAEMNVLVTDGNQVKRFISQSCTLPIGVLDN